MSYLNYKYNRYHLWINVNADTAVVGLTNFAIDKMGKALFVEFPEVGQVLQKGDELVTIELENDVTDFYSPLSGTVIEINNLLTDEAELLNNDPFDKGWLVKIKYTNASELSKMVDYGTYKDMANN